MHLPALQFCFKVGVTKVTSVRRADLFLIPFSPFSLLFSIV
jgi:hypothetical protein